jgi:multidrug resistance efflux pump
MIKSIILGVALLVSSACLQDARAVERNLSFAVSGIVTKILVRPGQSVKAGEALAQLDTANINSRLTAGKAALAAAGAAYKIAGQHYDFAREQFEAVLLSKAELDAAELEKAAAFAKLARITSKIEIGNWRLNQMTLRAPKAGKVVRIQGYKGMVVSLKASVPAVITLDMP